MPGMFGRPGRGIFFVGSSRLFCGSPLARGEDGMIIAWREGSYRLLAFPNFSFSISSYHANCWSPERLPLCRSFGRLYFSALVGGLCMYVPPLMVQSIYGGNHHAEWAPLDPCKLFGWLGWPPKQNRISGQSQFTCTDSWLVCPKKILFCFAFSLLWCACLSQAELEQRKADCKRLHSLICRAGTLRLPTQQVSPPAHSARNDAQARKSFLPIRGESYVEDM